MIKAITGGYINIHPSTFRMSRPKGLPHFVLLVVRSHGSFDIGSEHFSVEPPQIIILAPHTPNYYGNPDGDYIDDWLHFDTDEPKLKCDQQPPILCGRYQYLFLLYPPYFIRAFFWST